MIQVAAEMSSSPSVSATAVDLSVVVPVLNARATLGHQLESLKRQQWTGTWEVIVADNGSTDGGTSSVREMEKTDARFKLVDATAARGPAAARNLGVEAARGRNLAFCDADDVVGRGWLAAVGDALKEHDAVTGPQEQTVLNPDWATGVHGSSPADRLQTFEGLFPFAPSSNLGIRREVFEDLGGFDPSIRVGEDVDLSLRLWLAGHQLHFEPSAIVHYRHRTSGKALFHQAVQYGAAAPLIVRRIAENGIRRPSRIRGLRSWVWLLRNVHTVRSKAGRARWAVVAGRALGRTIGAVQHRTLFL